MKKVFSIVILSLLIATAISVGLCFAIIPERTKLAMDIVVEWLDKPLFIAGGTTITAGLVAYFIIRAIYDRVKDSVKKETNSCKEALNEKEKVVDEKLEKARQYKEEAKTIVLSLKEEVKELKNYVVEICETSPNAKIKAIVEKINGSCELIETELNKKLAESEEYSQETLLSLESRLHELEKVVKSYEAKE